MQPHSSLPAGDEDLNQDNVRSGPAAAHDERHPGPVRPTSAPSNPPHARISLSTAVGDLSRGDIFPSSLELTSLIDDAVFSVCANSPTADFRGGFRRVYLLTGHRACETLVLKVGKTPADNAN